MERFEMHTDYTNGFMDIIPIKDKDGQWVKYTDYQQLKKEIEELKEQIKKEQLGFQHDMTHVVHAMGRAIRFFKEKGSTDIDGLLGRFEPRLKGAQNRLDRHYADVNTILSPKEGE